MVFGLVSYISAPAYIALAGGRVDGTHMPLSARFTTSFAIMPDGSLWGWGGNHEGQLGDGTATDREFPVRIMDDVVAVSSGYAYTMAITSDGSLWGWGANRFGQLGDGTLTPRYAPVRIMDDVIAVSTGCANFGTVSAHTMALTSDGTLWSWGHNHRGQVGDGTTVDRIVPVEIMGDVVAISAGCYHSMAIRADGSLWTWGYNSEGQLGDGSTTARHSPIRVMENIAAASAGCRFKVAVGNDGVLWAWGRNDSGEIGDGTTTNRRNPVNIIGDVVAVATGGRHVLAITSDGILWAWGRNSYGQLGDGTTTNRNSPVMVMGNVEAIAAGYWHSLAVATDGRILSWGQNGAGQLGIGMVERRNLPGEVHIGRSAGTSPIPHALENREIRFYSVIGGRNGMAMLPWGSSLFDRSSNEFNADLANIAMALSLAAYDRDMGNDDNAPDVSTINPGAFIDFSLYMLGFDGDSILLSNYNQLDFPHGSVRGRPSPERVASQRHRADPNQEHKVGYAFARQTIISGRGEEYELVVVVVRGTQGNYGNEWYSNFDIFRPGETQEQASARIEHFGFSTAAGQLRAALDSYISADPNLRNADNIKFLVTGHSRGAAVANLVAHRLSTDNVHTSGRNVYAYTFATPNPVRMSEIERSGNVGNIFNFVNAEDFVTYMPLSVDGWDFWKWGQTWAFPSRNVADRATSNAAYDAMNTHFRDLTGGVSHRRFTSGGILHPTRSEGYAEVQRLVRDIHGIAPTAWEYSSTRHMLTVAGLVDAMELTTREFMHMFLCDKLTYGADSHEFVLALISGPFSPVVGFFAAHHVMARGSGRIMHAHAPETYLAWMKATDFSDMLTDIRGGAYLRARIACPVDFEVFDSQGSLVGAVRGDLVVDASEDSVSLFVEGDVKDLYLPVEGDYTIRFTGTGAGTMDFTIEKVDMLTGRVLETRHYSDVPLFDGKVMVSEIGFENVAETPLFVLENGEIVAFVQIDGSLVPLAAPETQDQDEPDEEGVLDGDQEERIRQRQPAEENQGISNTQLVVIVVSGIVLLLGATAAVIIVMLRRQGKSRAANMPVHKALCGACGAELPEAARFCAKCGWAR